ncbi:MAG TPA: ERF family protein [Sphingopyxis sp.]|nr:ERF family protein [Sphingopyxis sp.]HMP45905.1 ERF family protein [Sphingopyxis sp.]
MTAVQKVEASLASAYVAAFAEIEGAVKDAKNPHFKSKYADLPAVIAAIKPALVKHGLAFTQPCEPSSEGVTVRTILHHASGEALDLGSLFVPANKRDAQGFGSALTYARRYALVSAFGVPTEDDDGNAASASVARQHSAVATINQAQFEELELLMGRSGTTAETICKGYGIAAVAMLPASKFPKLKERLETTAKELERTAA